MGSTRPAKSESCGPAGSDLGASKVPKGYEHPLLVGQQSPYKMNIADPIHIQPEKVIILAKENTALLPTMSSGGVEESK